MSDRAIAVIAEDLAARLTQQQARLVYAEDAPLVAKWALAALKAARIECVELSDPADREDGDNFTDFPADGVGLYVPVVFDHYPGEIQIRAGAWCDEPLSVTEARALAASILAAAEMAEGAES